MRPNSVKRFTGLFLLTMVAALLLSSCAAMDYATYDTDYAEYVPSAPLAEEYLAEPAMGDYNSYRARVEEMGTRPVEQRQVIRTGSIELTVRDTRETVREVREIVEEGEGIVGSSSVYEIREGQYGANMTLRIPEKNFDRILEQIQALGKAPSVQTSLDDVTMEYIDLQSRLDNQVAQEKRLVEILEMAESVEEVLEVERELYRVRGEIESMTATLTHLKDRIAYSTLYLTLRDESIPTETISPGAFENIGERFMHTLIGSINFLLSATSFFVLAFAALLPVLIIIFLLVLLLRYLLRRSARRKAAAREKAGVEKGEA